MEYNNSLVSIVVPIYNAMNCLDRCIKSILNQTYKNIELILVDDGSKDLSPQICDEYKKKDSRIKVIHKKNEGAGISRSVGIKEATGKYILFVDSDDYIKKNLIEKCLKYIEQYTVDVVLFGCIMTNDNGENKEIIPNVEKNLYYNREVQDDFLPEFINYNPKNIIHRNLILTTWSQFFKIELFKKYNVTIASEREIYSEDVYSILDIYKNVQGVFITQDCLYYHYYNKNSLSVSRKIIYNDVKKFYEKTINLAKKNNYSEVVLERLKYPFINFSIGAIKKELMMSKENNKEKFVYISNIVNDTTFITVINSLYIKKEKISKRIFILLLKKKKIKMMIFLSNIKRKLKI